MRDRTPDRDEAAREYADNLTVIRERLPLDEILAQLGEEAAELAQAANKLRRATGGINPTTASKEQAVANICEEFADVELCWALAEISGDLKTDETKVQIKRRKAKRWRQRLESARKNGAKA